MSLDLSILVRQYEHEDVQRLALQRNRFPQLSDADFRFLLQQIEGRQRTRDKLPTFAQMSDWWYPVRLSCEQCSSEATARYKAQQISPLGNEATGQADDAVLIDLTGGYGVDTYFMSEHFAHVHYVERNAELCAIAEHNFALGRPHIEVHNSTAEEFLASSLMTDGLLPNTHRCIYLDPARRSRSGGKVFRIEDCEPNVVELLPTLRKYADTIMIKFSPMLDIAAAWQSLGEAWDVHVVAWHNEVKEVLLMSGRGQMVAVNMHHDRIDRFCLTRAEEKSAQCLMATAIGAYLYEPNAAIIKAGAFRLVAQRFNLHKIDTNTHLYTSDVLLSDFPGRVWQVVDANISKHTVFDPQRKYSIISRNYPLSPEQLRKKYKLLDGDDLYIIGVRHMGKPLLLLASRL